MSEQMHTSNEWAAAKAFSRQSYLFDAQYGNDTIVQYKRSRVRNHVMKYLSPHANILELNAGTGEDAVFFAQQGHTVHATDISQSMQHLLIEKAKAAGVHMRIGNEICSFTGLDQLKNRGPFDLVFSNFAGLNCTQDLAKVLLSLNELVKPGGIATLVILPKFCLWELLMIFRGKFKTGLRRFSGKGGTRAKVEGEYFRCWYYNPSFVVRNLSTHFELIDLEGLCTLVPPSYLEGFAEKHPKIYRFLERKENSWKSVWPWNRIGDYYIMTLRKKE